MFKNDNNKNQCVCVCRTSPGTVDGGDGRSALHRRDEGWLKIKQVTVQVGHTEEQWGGGESESDKEKLDGGGGGDKKKGR